MKRLKNIVLIGFLWAPLALFAQRDSINKEVVVVKEFDPTITDANKINSMPGMPEKPKVNKSFQYNVSENSYTPPLAIYPLSAESFTEPSRYTDYQNHISGGLGNYNSFYLDGFYNAYKSDVHQLDLYAHHHSTLGNIKLEDGNLVDAPFSRNKLGMGYIKRFAESEFRADVFFNNRNTRYYGYQTVNDSSVYTYDTLSIPGNELRTSDKQYFNDINFVLNYHSTPMVDAPVKHNTTLAYYSMGDFSTNRENNINVNSDLFFTLNDNYAGLKIDMGYIAYNAPSDVLPHRNIPKNNIFMFGFSPYYYIDNDTWSLKLGFSGFGVAEANVPNKFMGAPDVEVQFDLIQDILRMYAGLSGDYEVHSYKDLSNENPFIAPNTKAVAVQKPIDFKAGIRAALLPGLDAHVSVGYTEFKNQHFFVNEVFADTSKAEYFTNMFTTMRGDGSYSSVDAELIYHGTDRLEVGATLNYKKYTLDTLGIAWHTPQTLLSAYGKYQITDQIEAQVLYRYRSEATARLDNSNTTKTLEAAHDLSLKGLYKYNDHFSGFVHLNNILMQKYYLWNGYPSQRLNVLVGLTYHF